VEGSSQLNLRFYAGRAEENHKKNLIEISDSHSEDGCLLGYCAV
jgi:hypothetical protein